MGALAGVLLAGAGSLLEAPGELLPEDGPPDVSAVGTDPLNPLLPPPRASGATGVRTSISVLGGRASLPRSHPPSPKINTSKAAVQADGALRRGRRLEVR